MKSFNLFFLGLIILASCQKQEKLIFNEGPVIVAGKIENAKNKIISLTTLELTGRVDHVAKLDSTGQFLFSVNILSAHDNYLNYGGTSTIFLEPNDSIYLTADGSDFKKTVKFSGDRVKFNQCLQKFFVAFGNILESEKFFEKKRDLAPNEFKEFAIDFFKAMDSKADSIAEIIKPKNNAIIWMHTYNKYRLAEDLIEYGWHHKNDLPADYNDYEKAFLQQGKNDMYCSQYYEDFIEKYYFGKLTNIDGFKEVGLKYQEETYAGLDAFFDFVNDNISNKTVKNLLLTRLTNQFVEKDYAIVDSIYSKFSQIVDDITCQNFILNRIDEKKAEPTNVKTLDNLITLDFAGEIFREIKEKCKGKVLYIDVWGTWCGGCIGSFPYSTKLYEEVKDKNIEFVYLCIKSSKSNWQKTIKEYNLKGMQYLLTDDQDAILSEKFNFQGVPRYIIIDKYGNIFDNNAKDPYSSALKDELLSLTNI